MSEVEKQKEIDSNIKYLIYRIGTESYASPLLSIREVLEYQKPKSMPNMVQYFSGVVNVRGAIVGVVDMRRKFKQPEEIARRTAFLLCDTDRGPIAAVVDSVDGVAQWTTQQIDPNPPVQMKVRQSDVLGVAQNGEQLVILIDLHQSLAREEWKAA